MITDERLQEIVRLSGGICQHSFELSESCQMARELLSLREEVKAARKLRDAEPIKFIWARMIKEAGHVSTHEAIVAYDTARANSEKEI